VISFGVRVRVRRVCTGERCSVSWDTGFMHRCSQHLSQVKSTMHASSRGSRPFAVAALGITVSERSTPVSQLRREEERACTSVLVSSCQEGVAWGVVDLDYSVLDTPSFVYTSLLRHSSGQRDNGLDRSPPVRPVRPWRSVWFVGRHSTSRQ